ncbi:MAG: hypothetical protein R3B67_04255 [Phycisphaerales bacterium]
MPKALTSLPEYLQELLPERKAYPSEQERVSAFFRCIGGKHKPQPSNEHLFDFALYSCNTDPDPGVRINCLTHIERFASFNRDRAFRVMLFAIRDYDFYGDRSIAIQAIDSLKAVRPFSDNEVSSLLKLWRRTSDTRSSIARRITI